MRPTALRVQPSAARRRAMRHDGAGVSDVVGNILLVGITVAVAAGLAFLLFSFDGPDSVPQANLDVSVQPGTGSWGTGDETIVVRHGGGDPLDVAELSVRYSINNGATTTLTGSGLGISDGKLSIGDVWRSAPLTLQAADSVHINVVSTAAVSSALVATDLIPAQVSAGASCPFDTIAPSGSWTQGPADLTIAATTAVTVTVLLTDGCAGVDPDEVPHLFWGISPGTPIDRGAMTSVGTNQWQGTIPIPAGGWGPQGLKTLSYYASPLVDLRGNSGATPTRNDVIDLVGATQTYVGTATNIAPTPALGSPANLGAEDAAFTTVTEGANAPTCTAGTATLSADAVLAAGGWTNGDRAFTSNDQWATKSSQLGGGLRLRLTNPSTVCDITQIRFKIEVSITGWNNDDWRVEACLSGTCSAALAPDPQDGNAAPDQTKTWTLTAAQSRPGGGSWTPADVDNMEIRVTPVRAGGSDDGTWQLDRAWVEVDSTAPASTYTGTAQLDWANVPGTTRYLDLRYVAGDEAFSVNVWQWTGPSAGSYVTRGSLTATTTAQFVYLLTADEVSTVAGANQVRVRLVDTNPSDTVQASTLNLDYARVASV